MLGRVEKYYCRSSVKENWAREEIVVGSRRGGLALSLFLYQKAQISQREFFSKISSAVFHHFQLDTFLNTH